MKKLIPFGWYGGKFSHLPWLLPLLPKCHHYCEPFAGSGAVLINRPPSPIETYNDLDGETCNFFQALRDQKEELIELIGLTPVSRKESKVALSGYDCELMADLYPSWVKTVDKPKTTHVTKGTRIEVLWTNYKVEL